MDDHRLLCVLCLAKMFLNAVVCRNPKDWLNILLISAANLCYPLKHTPNDKGNVPLYCNVSVQQLLLLSNLAWMLRTKCDCQSDKAVSSDGYFTWWCDNIASTASVPVSLSLAGDREQPWPCWVTALHAVCLWFFYSKSTQTQKQLNVFLLLTKTDIYCFRQNFIEKLFTTPVHHNVL